MATCAPALCSRKAELTLWQPSADLSNLPIALSYYKQGTETTIPDMVLDSGDAHCALSDGGDVCFSSDAAGTNQLACEIVDFTQHGTESSRHALIWVIVPTLSSSSATKIWIWWNATAGTTQPAVNASYGANAVWESYAEVWHMGASSTADTSSKKSNDATWGGSGTARDTSGKLGNATAFNGSGYADAASFTGYASTADHAYSCWVKKPNATGGWAVQSMTTDDNSTGDGIGSSLANNRQLQFYCRGGYQVANSTDTISDDTWTYIAGVIVGGATPTLTLYRNTSTQSPSMTGKTWNASNYLCIASRQVNYDYKLTGSIQEVRVRSAASTDAWCAAEYASVNDTSAMVTNVGTPQDTTAKIYIAIW